MKRGSPHDAQGSHTPLNSGNAKSYETGNEAEPSKTSFEGVGPSSLLNYQGVINPSNRTGLLSPEDWKQADDIPLDLQDPAFQRELVEATDFLDDLVDHPAPQSRSCAACGGCGCQCMVNATRQALSFIKTHFGTQTLTGRWLYQLFIELKRYNWAPVASVQKTWLGWPIIGSAFVMTVAIKILNHYKSRNNAQDHTDDINPFVEEEDAGLVMGEATIADHEYERALQYLGSEDIVSSIFSSSILYVILDVFKDNATSLDLSWFIAASAGVPVVGAILFKLASTDSTNKIITLSDMDRFPKYPDASVAEKLLNAAGGLAYGANITVLFWVLGRELAKETVPMEMWQIAATAVSAVGCATAGYKMTDHPKVYHVFTAVSKILRDSSLTYAGLSGVAYLTLMYAYGCSDTACWEGGQIENILTGTFAAISALTGVNSALTHLIRFEEQHEARLDLIDKICAAPGKIKRAIIAAPGWVAGKLASCCCLFSRNNDPQQDGQSALEMHTEMSSLNEKSSPV